MFLTTHICQPADEMTQDIVLVKLTSIQDLHFIHIQDHSEKMSSSELCQHINPSKVNQIKLCEDIGPHHHDSLIHEPSQSMLIWLGVSWLSGSHTLSGFLRILALPHHFLPIVTPGHAPDLEVFLIRVHIGKSDVFALQHAMVVGIVALNL